MTIAHQKLANNFTIIANACINDPRLGFEALAIFIHLRSKPGNWVVRPNEIAARFKAGRDRVRKALNQLVECGYIGKAQTRDPATGRLGAVEYVVRVLAEAAPAEVEITASPSIAPPSPESPSPENPSTVIRSLLSTDLLPSTDSTKEDNSRPKADALDASVPKVDRSNNAERSPRRYRQSPAEAARAWDELKRLDGWQTVWGEDELTHWHRLLREGCAADDIVDFAISFIRKTQPCDVPSLGDFLQCFESYLDEAGAAASLPPIQQHHHHAHA
jgi:hypothetical protein